MRTLVVLAFFLQFPCLGQERATAPTPQQSPPATPAAVPGAPKDDGIPPVFRTRVEEVSLIFTVTDKHGRFVKDLTLDQFKILDDNRPPKQILKFEAQTNLPLRVGLLIDASNSIRERFSFEQKAATEFLQGVVRRATDKAFVLAFDETWDVTQDLTNDLDLLRRGMNKIRPGGGTAMWDSVFYACRDKLMQEKTTGPVRRAIILISDGDDTQSRVRPKEAIEMAQRAEVIIYAISTNLTGNGDAGDKNLRALAEATGGRAFFPSTQQELPDAFAEVEGELRSQYAVAYKPADLVLNGQFRTIHIAAGGKGFKVRARRGYFTPKE